MTDLDLAGRRVLIREDLNVPVKNGCVASAKRIEAALPTIRLAMEQGASVILLSHRGRPDEGRWDEEFSLLPVAQFLKDQCGREVQFEKNWLDGIDTKAGQLTLCENVRFQIGELGNDEQLARKRTGDSQAAWGRGPQGDGGEYRRRPRCGARHPGYRRYP